MPLMRPSLRMPTLARLQLAFAQLFALTVVSVVSASLAMADPYDAPVGYYGSATGTGGTLKSQLQTIMSNGHILRTYGNFRDSAAITDRDPDNPSNILLAYNRASVRATWDSGRTWNREHTWPQSRQPGSASNGTTGNLGDPHALRPANPQVNSNRGNDPFGTISSSGSHGAVGSFYFPGDEDKGDTARQLFYSATRYNGLTLVNGSPGSNQMGDLASLIRWHYADGPDDFERRRNHTIYSQAENPSFYTNNRNAFVDHPEFVWSVFVDQANDTQLTASASSIDLGRVYIDGATPALQSVTVNKGGTDGTYYNVTTTGAATSTAGDVSRALAMGPGVSDTFAVGLDVSTAVAGLYSGSVVVDNLDVTTGGGAGRGANDLDDVIDLSFAVLEHPVASFAGDTVMNELTIDFGQITLGETPASQSVSLFNYDGAGAPAFASLLDLDAVVPGLGSDGFFVNLLSGSSLVQGDSILFDASLVATEAGSYETTYTIDLSGEDLPGEQQQMLSLTLVGEILAGLEGDYNGDGFVNAADYTVYRDTFGSTSDLRADGDASGQVDAADLGVWSVNFGASTPTSVAVPEPAAGVLAAFAMAGLLGRRRE